jgi:hypothetical protein
MSRRCVRCRRTPRRNDPLYAVHIYASDEDFLRAGWPQGGYDVCHDCAVEGFGLDRVAPLPFPADMPDGWGDWWCPVCRNFMRENDPASTDMRCVRLTEEDCELFLDLRPGAIRCCSECWPRLATIVLERWKREGLCGPYLQWEHAGLNLV